MPVQIPGAPRKRRQRPETVLQISVFKILRALLAENAVYFHVPNGGKRTAAEAGLFKAMGVLPGVPDIVILQNGKAYFIELKAAGGQATEKQNELHGKLRAHGFNVGLARNVTEVGDLLALWGLKVGGRINA